MTWTQRNNLDLSKNKIIKTLDYANPETILVRT